MDNWKTAVVAASVATGVILLIKGKRTAGLAVAGIGAATLAAEYPDKFAEIRESAREYMTHGLTFLDVASRVGQRISDVTEGRLGERWYESLLEEEN
jgi:hypothetical protein